MYLYKINICVVRVGYWKCPPHVQKKKKLPCWPLCLLRGAVKEDEDWLIGILKNSSLSMSSRGEWVRCSEAKEVTEHGRSWLWDNWLSKTHLTSVDKSNDYKQESIRVWINHMNHCFISVPEYISIIYTSDTNSLKNIKPIDLKR